MRVQIEYDQDGRITAISGVVSVEHPDGDLGRSARFVRPGHFILDLDTEVMADTTDMAGLRRLATEYSIAGHPDHPRLVGRDADE
ncbi:hypothetical protein [Nocardia sp. NBC_01329]|uniref:hypothetical protein n=1 Tax=Nocardia sp. NBC_01329 TaxID=2903594 RepID=UPI002E139C54|nr:hypothetical protein OG405_11770 [Nocardia sp. NBC_01329]